MKKERKLIPQMTLEQFADKHKLTMQIIEREQELAELHGRFIAHFKGHPDISVGCFRAGKFGNGNTEEEAIEDYRQQISGKLLIFGYGEKRKEIQVPYLE